MVFNSSKFTEIWNEVLVRLEPQINDNLIFNAFFSESALVDMENNVASVMVSTQYIKGVITSNSLYMDVMSQIFNDVTESIYKINIIDRSTYEAKKAQKESIIQPLPFSLESNLKSEYTFENFVVGPSNRECQTAAVATAINPGKFYNPLFIFGNSGLGKTHLIHSIGNYIRTKNKNMNILYISAQSFIDEYFKCIREQGLDALLDKFKKVDVLLLDDIHHLSKKPQVTEYFFNIFNLLINSNKQIVLTSDRPPLELKNIEERLISRFSHGLQVGVSSPEFETALKILKKKIEVHDLNEGAIDEEVLSYMAQTFNKDIRQLEGALNRLLFVTLNFSNERNINLDDAIKSLKVLKVKDNSVISVEKIKRVVADYYNISINELTSKIRTTKITIARHMAIYLTRELLDQSLNQIGTDFGGRDHSTIISACEKVDKMLKEKEDYRTAINELKTQLKS